MAIGEAGSISANSPTTSHETTVTFTEPLVDPVIALTGSSNGGDPYVLRVTDIQTNADGEATGFTFRIEEWEYLDDIHNTVEDINWLAIEAGVHTLPDGRIIEAGTTSATHVDSAVTFTGGFTDPPVVLTSVMSENDTTTVDSDPTNVTATGFDVSLEEEEAEDGVHAAETVGYIAIEAGSGTDSGSADATHLVDDDGDTYTLGAIFSDPVILGETQTQNGPDPGNVMLTGNDGSSADFFLDEETSLDTETNHGPETLGIVTFEDGLIMCFTPEGRVATPYGVRRIADIAEGDPVLTRDRGVTTVLARTETVLTARQLREDPDLAPVLITRGALAPDVPDRDLKVSPQHRMLITGWQAELAFGAGEVLVPAKALVNGTTIRQLDVFDNVTYMHLVLDAHHIVTVDNAPSESLHVGHVSKAEIGDAARATLFDVYPDLRTAADIWQPVRPVLSVREGRALRPALF